MKIIKSQTYEEFIKHKTHRFNPDNEKPMVAPAAPPGPKMAQHWIRPNPNAQPQAFSDEDMTQQLNALDPELGNLYMQNVSRTSNPHARKDIGKNFYMAIKTKDAQHIQALKKKYAIPSHVQQPQQPQ